ncbi:formate dehydrogenase accessory sulfurtransferase FdhD [Chitinophaga japonensis]|uniref:Sulfur carrier protein FdhD n=1 Tax=Chitinophaga japonensis TaxID=104662 RepID=A0A562SYP9_CHIJA|nr:formate dehydrogenase accessory sulfurtransferase FdhD [Chitinophaga japonensis]TWI86449.1 FdhD protein [Chitinophaga japonensis]
MSNPAILYTRITKVDHAQMTEAEDALAAEEPLEIRLLHGPAHNRRQQRVTVTMRTPGDDRELATGFLFTEGMIRSAADIADIRTPDNDSNLLQVSLREHVQPVLPPVQRNFYANSGCGVCGKASTADIFTPVRQRPASSVFTFPAARLLELPGILRQQQSLFENTGGLHAAALFDADGQLLLLREDIGRHNAVDKVIGAALATAGGTHLPGCLLLLSGRAGFELIQKAAMAAIPMVAAVGAPSGMAVKMAQEWDITLIGFLRQQRCNIYTNAERLTLNA